MELSQDEISRVVRRTLPQLTGSLQLSIDFIWDEIQNRQLGLDDIEDLEVIAFNALAIIHKLKNP